MADQIDPSVIADAPSTPPDVPGQIDSAVTPADAAPGADLPQPDATPADAVEPMQDAKPVDDGAPVIGDAAPVADGSPVADVEGPNPIADDSAASEAEPFNAPVIPADVLGNVADEAPKADDAAPADEVPADEGKPEEAPTDTSTTFGDVSEDAPKADDAPVTDTAVAVPDVGETPTEDVPLEAPAAPEAPAADPVTGAPADEAPTEVPSADGELPKEDVPVEAPSAPDAPAADPVTGKPLEEEAAPVPGAAETEAAPKPSDDEAPKNYDGSDGIAGEGPTHSGTDTPPVLTTNPADPVDGKPLAPQGDAAAPQMGVDPGSAAGPKVPAGFDISDSMGGVGSDEGLGSMRFASGVKPSEAPSENSDTEDDDEGSDFDLSDDEIELIEKLRDLKELFHSKGTSTKHLMRRAVKWLEKMLRSLK